MGKQEAERANNEDILSKFETSPLYFSRTRGLFRECFHGEKDNAPKIGDDLYMSPVETWCHNLNYYIPDDTRETKEFTPENMTRIHMGRSTIALFISCFVMMFIAFITGVIGCWKTGHSHIFASACLMLIACLMSAGAMGLWHESNTSKRKKSTMDTTMLNYLSNPGNHFYEITPTSDTTGPTSWLGWAWACVWPPPASLPWPDSVSRVTENMRKP